MNLLAMKYARICYIINLEIFQTHLILYDIEQLNVLQGILILKFSERFIMIPDMEYLINYLNKY